MSAVQNLHTGQCQQTEADLKIMTEKLGLDPEALERRAEFSFCGQLTPLQSAVYRNHSSCVYLLLSRGALVNAVTGTGHHTALYIAVYRNYLSMVEILLKNGASTKSHLPTYANPEGGLLCGSWYFHLAVTFEFYDIAKLLVEHGSETEDFDEHTGLQILFAAEIAATKASADLLLLALKHSSLQLCALKHSPLVLTTSYKWAVFSDEHVNKLKRTWLVLNKFGHSFWYVDRKGRTLLELVKQKCQKNAQFNDSSFKELQIYLEKIVSTPLTLQDICRISIRQNLGYRAQTKIDQISGIPSALKSFLKFDCL